MAEFKSQNYLPVIGRFEMNIVIKNIRNKQINNNIINMIFFFFCNVVANKTYPYFFQSIQIVYNNTDIQYITDITKIVNYLPPFLLELFQYFKYCYYYVCGFEINPDYFQLELY